MSQSQVNVTPGSGKSVATYNFVDADGQTRDLGRVTLNDWQGSPYINANPVPVGIQSSSGSLGVYFDRGEPTVKVKDGGGTIQVYIAGDTGHTIGYIDGSRSSIAVYFDRGNPAVNVTNFSSFGATSSVGLAGGTVSGTFTGVSTLGKTLISPAAGYAYKVYAISLTTTATINNVASFTNGAGVGPTEYWRVALNGNGNGAMGANLAVTPPGFLFATATNTTLALLLDGAGSLVHYSVAYFKESS